MTVGLIAINVAVFLGLQLPDLLQSDICGQMVSPSCSASCRSSCWHAGDARRLRAAGRYPIPEPLTLISYQFLHGDFLHLLGNMLFLWVFGDNVEDALGHVKFLIFYLLCGIAGGLAHVWLTADPSAPLIGASAAIAGVVGAYLVLHPNVNVWVLVHALLPAEDPGRLGARRLGAHEHRLFCACSASIRSSPGGRMSAASSPV